MGYLDKTNKLNKVSNDYKIYVIVNIIYSIVHCEFMF